ncbi:DNA cytosine methyltransferase [Devosia salina]|jgi:DNA (cytosine-5)-methyltransferase 1|uniref:DNA (cytosine-5-)-methyltransferase n=1 Tax=Devosia salina TaxID=2860336 RepID=A0ABX8WCG0_9HYPH|nr:DNA cytosine methyltransferase [Devosia salina]QYO76568.1 DNA cytosine methyltransferase [Devosia salina]
MIDIFAGPGGLSEGFSRYADWFNDEEIQFRSVLSIEKDETAIRTLTLRAFYRQFVGELPPEYWAVVKGQASVSILEGFPEWKAAQRHVWQAELGVVSNDELHTRIELRLKGADEWLLIGGPPCQAYSLMGRARMTGIGFEGRSDAEAAEETRRQRLESFHKDVRHVLYREYLRIIAVHQPTAFVMENVRGILSAKLPGADGSMHPVFDRIRSDLQDPWASLADDEDLDQLRSLARPGSPRYRLHALSVEETGLWQNEPSNADFLLKSEDFGVPQRRHRVIVVGIREDHSGSPAPLKRARSSTVRDAIGQMPIIRSGLSAGKDSDVEWSARRACAALPLLEAPIADGVRNAVQTALADQETPLDRGGPFVSWIPANRKNSVLDAWLSSPELKGIIQHESRTHMDSDLARYLYAAASAQVTGRTPRLHQWPKELLPKHRNVAVGKAGEIDVSGFLDRFKVQIWDEPSSTVTSHIAKDGHYFIHPDPSQNRSLTVREAARLQTFPDDYFFCGNRTQQYHQVGNAVPPLLAVQLARSVSDIFRAGVTLSMPVKEVAVG